MASSAYYYVTGAAGNQKTLTLSGWFKIFDFSDSVLFSYHDQVSGSSARSEIYVNASSKLLVGINPTGSTWKELTYPNLIRDPGAWYHVVVAYDTTQSVEADRVKVYLNGNQLTAASGDYPSLNEDTGWNANGMQHTIGRYEVSDDNYLDGCVAHVNFIDGTAYAPTAFGEFDSTSGIWIAKSSPSVTYGDEGAFFKFASDALTTDSSGNGNTLTAVGTPTATKDNPDNNFSTWNSLNASGSASYGMAYSNGNTTISPTSPDANGSRPWTSSSLGMPASGKWYAEFKLIANDEVTQIGIGSADIVANRLYYNNAYGDTTECLIWEPYLGKIIYNGSYLTEGLTAAVGNDILGIAVDCVNEKMYCYINGSLINSGGESYTSKVTGSQILYLVGDNTTGGYDSVQANFGNGYFGTTAVSTSESDDAGIGSFEYDVPAGYYALCTTNLGDQS